MEERSIYKFRKGEDGAFHSYLVPPGSRDGRGAGDRDEPFQGFSPTHFSLRQMSRLLLLRGRVLDAKMGQGPLTGDLQAGEGGVTSG